MARRIPLVKAVLAAALLIPGFASNALAAGSVSGQITDSVTHVGLAGARVQFYDLNTNSDFPAFTATADGSGNYSQNLPDGSYGLLTQNSQGYINKIWNDIPCSATCNVNSLTAVTVSGGAIIDINFALDSGGGRIAGTITSSATGNPIVGALVLFLDSAGNVPFASATTDGSGHYISDGGSANGNVLVVTVNGQGYQDEVYNNHKTSGNSAADPVAVLLGATTSGIDFALDPGGRISGTVKDVNNSPLANVDVRTYDSTGNKVDDVLTDGSGNFATSGLPTGTYYVATRNSLGLVDYVWDNLVCAHDSCNDTNGTPIAVTVPATTSGINFILPPGQTISGTVTAALGGAPISGVGISIMNASGAFVGSANTDASGHFTTGALPEGTYFANTFVNGYVNQLYNNVSCANNNCPITVGTPIVVTNQAVTNINFSLLATGTGSATSVTGTVTDGFNNNLPTGISVQLFSPSGQLVATTTTTTGVYSFSNIAAGSYFVRTNTNAAGVQPGGIPFINQVYNGITCVNCLVQTSGGTLVTVSNGGTTSNINFTLQRGGVISGTITKASDGTPLASVGAQIFNSAGLSVGTYNTNASGVFFSAGLPPGTYYVRTSNNLGYINQQWQNLACPQTGCLPTSGTPVVVNGAQVSGIDFALTLGGRISGTVTDASNAQALQFIPVAVFSSAGINLGTVSTDASGNYTTSGLPPGNYFLRTQSGPLFVNNQSLGFVDQLWSGTQCVPACLNATLGTPVMVTGGNTTTGIDFALSRGGMISGAVIDAATGTGLSVAVQIYTSAGLLAKTAGTNSAGGYTVAGLPAGTYYARTNVPNGVFFKDALYNGMPCSSGCSVTTGTPITVLAGVISNGVDFALSSGAGGIAGKVTDARTAAPVPGISIQIFTASGVYTKTVLTGLAGTYGTSGLAPGTYYARTLQETIPAVYADQLYSGSRCPSNCTVTTGTPIVVTAGATTNGIDFALGGPLTNGDFLRADFDGDGKTDIAVWRSSTGTWFVSNSSNGTLTARTWGAGYAPYNDVPVHGDYDGDGKTDVGVWRPSTGTWYVVNSSNGSVTARTWGAGYAPYNDIPVPGDYDGDHKTDFAIWRPSTGTWYVVNSSNGSVTARTWGAPDDIPVPADYDGDGKTDFAVWRPSTGTWFVINSSNGSVTARTWGAGVAPYNDVPVPGDYDGDGKTDFAVWRPSTGAWYVVNSSNGSVTARTWGAGFAPYNDVPVPGDYDGDGKTDFAIWRASTGTWYVINSSNGSVTGRTWGASQAPYNDVAVPTSGIR